VVNNTIETKKTTVLEVQPMDRMHPTAVVDHLMEHCTKSSLWEVDQMMRKKLNEECERKRMQKERKEGIRQEIFEEIGHVLYKSQQEV
jgi:hypothetical protein